MLFYEFSTDELLNPSLTDLQAKITESKTCVKQSEKKSFCLIFGKSESKSLKLTPLLNREGHNQIHCI